MRFFSLVEKESLLEFVIMLASFFLLPIPKQFIVKDKADNLY